MSRESAAPMMAASMLSLSRKLVNVAIHSGASRSCHRSSCCLPRNNHSSPKAISSAMTFGTNRRIALSSAIACLALILFSGQLAAASQAPSTNRAAQTIEDPGGRAMLSFYKALARAYQGEWVARIIHYGDSHVAADILTGALRRELQLFFGDAGVGFVLPGFPWPWYSRAGISSRASAGWQADGLTQASLASDGRLGLAGVSLTTSRSGEWMTVSATASYF